MWSAGLLELELELELSVRHGNRSCFPEYL